MRVRRTRVSAVTVIMAAVALILIVALAVMVIGEVAEVISPPSPPPPLRSVWFNDTAPPESPINNSGNAFDGTFASAILETAPEWVRRDLSSTGSVNWVVEHWLDRIFDQAANTTDSALFAQNMLYFVLVAPETFAELRGMIPAELLFEDKLGEFQLWLMQGSDEEYRQIALTFKRICCETAKTKEIRAIDRYVSFGSQVPNGVELSVELAEKNGRNAVPLAVLDMDSSVILAGGHELVLVFPKDEVGCLKLECGFQPIKTVPRPSGGSTYTPEPSPSPVVSVDVDEPAVSNPPDISVDIDERDPPPSGNPPSGGTPYYPPSPPGPSPKDPSQAAERNPDVSDEAKPNPGNTSNTVNDNYGNGLDNSNPNGYQPSEADNRDTQAAAEDLAEDQHEQAEREYEEKTGGNTTGTADDSVVVDTGTHGPIEDWSNQDHTEKLPIPTGNPVEQPPTPTPTEPLPTGNLGEDLSGDWFS